MGKTTPYPYGRGYRRKHPHARGEDTTSPMTSALPSETPPRTWGRQKGLDIQYTKKRNTPTHVGKTRRSIADFVLAEKHPHARGEDAKVNSGFCPGGETPPRTWGRPEVGTELAKIGRNTPTHVGKTNITLRYARRCQKHPHARGEDFLHPPRHFGDGETPPRTWGRHKGKTESKYRRRNTPTHVGKTADEIRQDKIC